MQIFQIYYKEVLQTSLSLIYWKRETLWENFPTLSVGFLKVMDFFIQASKEAESPCTLLALNQPPASKGELQIQDRVLLDHFSLFWSGHLPYVQSAKQHCHHVPT